MRVKTIKWKGRWPASWHERLDCNAELIRKGAAGQWFIRGQNWYITWPEAGK